MNFHSIWTLLRDRWRVGLSVFAAVIALALGLLVLSGSLEPTREYRSHVTITGAVVEGEYYYFDTQAVGAEVAASLARELSTPNEIRRFASEHLPGVKLGEARETYSIQNVGGSTLDLRVSGDDEEIGASVIEALEQEVQRRATDAARLRLGQDAPIAVSVDRFAETSRPPAASWFTALSGIVPLAALLGVLGALLSAGVDRRVRFSSDLDDFRRAGANVLWGRDRSDGAAIEIRGAMPPAPRGLISVFDFTSDPDLGREIALAVRDGGGQSTLVRLNGPSPSTGGPTLADHLEPDAVIPSSMPEENDLDLELPTGLTNDVLARRLSPQALAQLDRGLGSDRLVVVDAGGVQDRVLRSILAKSASAVVVRISPGVTTKASLARLLDSVDPARLSIIA